MPWVSRLGVPSCAGPSSVKWNSAWALLVQAPIRMSYGALSLALDSVDPQRPRPLPAAQRIRPIATKYAFSVLRRRKASQPFCFKQRRFTFRNNIRVTPHEWRVGASAQARQWFDPSPLRRGRGWVRSTDPEALRHSLLRSTYFLYGAEGQEVALPAIAAWSRLIRRGIVFVPRRLIADGSDPLALRVAPGSKRSSVRIAGTSSTAVRSTIARSPIRSNVDRRLVLAWRLHGRVQAR